MAIVLTLFFVASSIVLLHHSAAVRQEGTLELDTDSDSQSLLEAQRAVTVHLKDCTDGASISVPKFDGKAFQLETDKTWNGENGIVYQASPPQDMNHLGLVAMKVRREDISAEKFLHEVRIMSRVNAVPHALHMLAACTIHSAGEGVADLEGRPVILMPWLPEEVSCASAMVILKGDLKIKTFGKPILSSNSASDTGLDDHFAQRKLNFIKDNVEFFCHMTAVANLVDTDRNFYMGNQRIHYNMFGEHNVMCTMKHTPPYEVHPLHFDFGQARNLSEAGDKRIEKMWDLTVGDAVLGAMQKVSDTLDLGNAWKPYKDQIRSETNNGQIFQTHATSALCDCLKRQSDQFHVGVDRVKQALREVQGMQCA